MIAIFHGYRRVCYHLSCKHSHSAHTHTLHAARNTMFSACVVTQLSVAPYDSSVLVPAPHQTGSLSRGDQLTPSHSTTVHL